jgi:hypothetical protein
MDFTPPPPPHLSKSGLKLVCNVKVVYGNLKSENSQDHAQKPQRNCIFMNSATVYVLQISCKTGFNEFPLEILKPIAVHFPLIIELSQIILYRLTVIPSEQTFPVKTLPWPKTTKL